MTNNRQNDMQPPKAPKKQTYKRIITNEIKFALNLLNSEPQNNIGIKRTYSECFATSETVNTQVKLQKTNNKPINNKWSISLMDNNQPTNTNSWLSNEKLKSLNKTKRKLDF